MELLKQKLFVFVLFQVSFECIGNLILVKQNNSAILKFPKYNIETSAYIGRNGVTNTKKEGDGKTPLGRFKLGIILSTKQCISNPKIKYKQITKDMYWVDDPKSKYYNQLVNISTTQKDWNSAEHLIDYPIQYEYLIEIKTNPRNIPGKGSAIFLHCSNNKPTAGCIAVDKEIMKKIIENINEQTKIKVFKEKQWQIKNYWNNVKNIFKKEK